MIARLVILPKAVVLGKVVADQAVGVFIGASLATVVGIGEVHRHTQFIFQTFKIIELDTIVEK